MIFIFKLESWLLEQSKSVNAKLLDRFKEVEAFTWQFKLVKAVNTSIPVKFVIPFSAQSIWTSHLNL